MSNITNIISKFKNKLINYQYVEDNDISTIPLNSHIIYICKNSHIQKSGFLRNIKENNILHLSIYNRNWFIFTNKYYIFYKLKKEDLLKKSLLNLVDNNFQIIKKSNMV